MPSFRNTLNRLLAVASLAALTAVGSAAHAQTATVTYSLEDLWLLPDTSHPGQSAQQMTGTFEWNYMIGDFENGSGQFLTMDMPWWGTDVGSLDVNIETGSIEFTLPGNWHDLGVDVTLHFLTPLVPAQAVSIDTVRSKFEIQRGISHQGHVISGSAVPGCAPLVNYGNGGEGSGEIVPTITSSGGSPSIGNAAFQVDCDNLLGGATCFLVAGYGKAQIPVRGIDLLVSPVNWFLVPMQADGTPGVPGAGGLDIPVPIPNDPQAVGVEVDFQLLVLDPGASLGVASTDGLSMVICSG